MPTGEGIKGGLFNVVGQAIDGIEGRSFGEVVPFTKHLPSLRT